MGVMSEAVGGVSRAAVTAESVTHQNGSAFRSVHIPALHR